MNRVFERLVVLVVVLRYRLYAATGRGNLIQERLRRYASPEDPIHKRLIRYTH